MKAAGGVADLFGREVQVYREYKHDSSQTEYTLFFKKDDTKYRIDAVIDDDTLVELGEHAEKFIKKFFQARIEAGDYTTAIEPVVKEYVITLD